MKRRVADYGSYEGRADRPHYVYRCYDADGVLLYVGCTLDPRTRKSTHRASSAWWPQAASFRLTLYPDREQARRAESRAIATEHPRHNIIGRKFEVVA